MIIPKTKLITFKNSGNLIKEYSGCGINSLLVLLDNLCPKHNITSDQLKEIFKYNDEGIRHERYRFNKLNSVLNSNGIPLKFYKKPFNTWQELFVLLKNNCPIPIFFSMKIIDFIKDKFKYSGMTFNFGNVFMDENQHLLLFMGYDAKKELLYFIDPIYQLPYYYQNYINDKKKLVTLTTKQFYECTKHTKSYIEINQQKIKKKGGEKIDMRLNGKKW